MKKAAIITAACVVAVALCSCQRSPGQVMNKVLTDFGVDMANDYMSGGVMTYQLFGSYLGGGLVILYAGRKFYWAVLKRSLGGSTAEPVERHVTWACRILVP